MRIVIPFIGKTKEGWIDEGIRDYSARLRRYLPLEIRELKEQGAHALMAREADMLLAQADTAALTVALDPQGRQHSSEEIAAILGNWEQAGLRSICFCIGGHLGLDERVKQRAGQMWSLSRLTFTHEMTRLILLEQLYRACSIRAGHRYHR